MSVDYENGYIFGKMIGEGSCGKVFLGKCGYLSQNKVVIKKTECNDVMTGDIVNKINQHSLLVGVYDLFLEEGENSYDPPLTNFTMEYCKNGDLHQIIERAGDFCFDEKTVRKFLIQGLVALKYMHDRRIIHRFQFFRCPVNLTGLNGRDLVTKVEELVKKKKFLLKQADFGFSTDAIRNNYECRGTPHYIAPALENRIKYGRKVDIFSWGMSMVHLMTGKWKPLSTFCSVLKTIYQKDEESDINAVTELAKQLSFKIGKSGKRKELVKPKQGFYSKELIGIIIDMIRMNKKERLDADGALERLEVTDEKIKSYKHMSFE